MSGGGTSPDPKGAAAGRETDPIAVLAQLASSQDEPYTAVHQHSGRSRLRSLTQAKGKQRYRLAGGEVVARPTARFAVAGDSTGAALVTCFAGRVEVRARHHQLSLEPHQAAIVQPNGDVEHFTSLAAAALGAERALDVHELLEAATRALLASTEGEVTSSTASTAASVEAEKTAALVGAAAAGAPEIVLPDASLDADDGVATVDHDDAEVEPFPDERRSGSRWLLAALGVAALIALVLLAVLPGDDDKDDDTLAGPATTIERAPTTADQPAATTVPETTVPPTTVGETTTTEAPATTTTIAPPTASIQPKSCVQQGSTITYTAGLTNTSKVRATYDIRVAFIDQTGNEVASATATVENLAPGSSKDWSATGSVPADLRNTGASCAVTSITGRKA